MNERLYHLGFSLVKGVGPKTFKLLLKHFKTAERAWNSDSKELKKAGLGDKLLQSLEKQRDELNLALYLEKLKHKKSSIIALCDKDYPKLLKEIENPPIVLFIKGNIKNVDFDKTIAVVGTRKITNYGKEVTKFFAFDLASAGFTVISGLAMGVDATAAWSAIEANGKTVAVLGNGVDLCFPSSNENLYDKILDNNGIIVSEFPLGFSPNKGSFPSRNRIIAGLSTGVLVTEGAEDSGALITAGEAFKIKRPVFAVPGPITSSLSKGPFSLIAKGAKLVTNAEDILKEFKISYFAKASDGQAKFKNLTKDELEIVRILQNEALHFDEIVRRLGLSVSETSSLVSVLEVKGLLKQTSGGYFKLI